MNPVAILVVPADGDPGGLLAPGRCGAMPPWALHGALSTGGWLAHYGRLGGFSDCIYALPLWWPDDQRPGGTIVPEGWDRLQRLVRREAQPLSMHAWHPRIERVRREAETAVCIGVVARVVLLFRVDGALVERS